MHQDLAHLAFMPPNGVGKIAGCSRSRAASQLLLRRTATRTHERGPHNTNGLFAFFCFFAARFSISVFSGFFFVPFFLSIPLLMYVSSAAGSE
jgi:hypothetical protein